MTPRTPRPAGTAGIHIGEANLPYSPMGGGTIVNAERRTTAGNERIGRTAAICHR